MRGSKVSSFWLNRSPRWPVRVRSRLAGKLGFDFGGQSRIHFSETVSMPYWRIVLLVRFGEHRSSSMYLFKVRLV